MTREQYEARLAKIDKATDPEAYRALHVEAWCNGVDLSPAGDANG